MPNRSKADRLSRWTKRTWVRVTVASRSPDGPALVRTSSPSWDGAARRSRLCDDGGEREAFHAAAHRAGTYPAALDRLHRLLLDVRAAAVGLSARSRQPRGAR